MNNDILILILVAAGLIVNVITLVVVLSRKTVSGSGVNEQLASVVQVAAASAPSQGIVFCRNCGNQYDSTLNECPNCKTVR